MQLEHGKRYRSRTGWVTTPLLRNRDNTFSGALDRKTFRWGRDGTFGYGMDSDWVLVEEVRADCEATT